LDIAVHESRERFSDNNDVSGHWRIVERLRSLNVGRVGVEASGHYEARLVRALRRAGFEVLVLDPAQVHGYRRFKNKRAKTDPIDAVLIAAATAGCDEIRAAPDERLAFLAEHLTLIEQIGEDIARLKTRLDRFEVRAHRLYLEREIKRLSRLRERELARLEAKVLTHDDLARRYALLQSIPGIGAMVGLALVVRMPELGRMSRSEAAALVGVAPFNADSGEHVGERHIAGGRQRVRRMVYLAAFAASQRWNPILVNLYRRLIAAGKHHKVAVTACARKLIEIANAVLTRGTPWRIIPV
jgi:transposase